MHTCHSCCFVFSLLLSLGLVSSCQRNNPPRDSSASDTAENRRAAAQRYEALTPWTEDVEELAQQIALQRAPEHRDALIQLLRREVRRSVIEQANVDALTRHFTVTEIKALADFNARPEARNIQRKMPAYTADLLPALQQEIARVLSMTNAALAALQWPTRLRAFQATASDDRLIADFSFLNRSERTVNILAITSTCACISGTASRTNYPPRYGGVVSVRFDFGPRIGKQSKYVIVQTDDPSEPQVRLQLDVDIPEVVRLAPPFSLWQVGEQPVPKTNQMALLYPGAQVEGIVVTNPAFRATWHPTSDTAGEIRVTPTTLAAREAGRLDVLVRVPPGVVRRFPLYLAIGSEKTPAH